MTTRVLPVSRQVKSYYPTTLTKSKKMIGLATSADTKDEIWTMIEYYSEIEEIGKNYLLSRGIQKRDLNKTYKDFKAYIRQAKSYYYSAEKLHYRSSSLLYYYCFLNLAKAGLILKNPLLGKSKLTHGLSFEVNRNFSKFNEVVVKTQHGKGQVFENFYNDYFNEQLKFPVLNISRLFGYVSDVQAESNMSGISSNKLLPAFFSSISDKDTQKSWGLIGIKFGNQYLEYKSRSARFINDYEQVFVDSIITNQMWGLDAAPHSYNLYFQERKMHSWISPQTPYPPYELGERAISALNKCFQPNLFGTAPNFFISIPYSKNRPYPMDETMAIYIIMFYLGSLVRYRPAYLEGLLDKKESWLISSFIRSSPLTFLRGIIEWIIQTDYRFIKR